MMNENKYLNEDKYQENVKKLKKIGKILLILGICILAIGFITLILGIIGFGSTGIGSFFNSEIDPEKTFKGIFGEFGLIALGGLLDSFGFFITCVGGIILIIAHRREIAAFTTQQVMPVAKEGINGMASTIGNAAGEIAKGIKKGLNEADKEDK